MSYIFALKKWNFGSMVNFIFLKELILFFLLIYSLSEYKQDRSFLRIVLSKKKEIYD